MESAITLEFESSNGTLITDEKGKVNETLSDIEDWLLTISKVDIEELDNYYKLNNDGKCEGGDVLDFCYWDKEGKYHKADKNWRLDTFHNQDFSSEKVIEIVEKSFNWIENNREMKTDVVFRVKEDEVFALFPHEVENRQGHVTSYQHVGQHSTADYSHCIRTSKKATKEQYAPLKKEMEGLGYTLNIVTRRNYNKWKESLTDRN